MKKRYHVLINVFILTIAPLVSNPIISLFFKPLPDTEKIARKLKNPGKIAKHSINTITQHNLVTGICATYAGYVDISDDNGEIRFPRKHSKSSVTIIITTVFEPVALFENSIHHWQLSQNTPASMYVLTEMYNQEDKDYSWHTQKTALPTDNVIPPTAIVIIAKPSRIIVPLKQYKTIPTANLTLPPLYVKK